MGIDPGRTNIGLAVVKEDGTPVFQAEYQTRNKEVPRLMKKRKAHRNNHRHYGRRGPRIRRAKLYGTTVKGEILERHLPGYGDGKTVSCHYIKNKEARFSNRKRPKGWLTPTANHLLLTHLNLVRKLMKFLLITQIVLELNKFAFAALENPKIQKWEYQKGPLNGYGSLKEAVFAMQKGKCLLCKKEEDLQDHHIVPRRKNGSDTIANLAGLCPDCHHQAHTDQKAKNKLERLTKGRNKKYHALSVLNQIIPKLTESLSELLPVMATTGRDTYAFRMDHNLPKEHWIDATCVACSSLSEPVTVAVNALPVHMIKQFRRHDRQACDREMRNRNYALNGKIVCQNRHKAFEQEKDSLEEYVAAGGRTDNLRVKRIRKAMKDMNRFLPGCQVIQNGRIKTLWKRAEGSYWFDDGSKTPIKKITITLQNTGLVFV